MLITYVLCERNGKAIGHTILTVIADFPTAPDPMTVILYSCSGIPHFLFSLFILCFLKRKSFFECIPFDRS